MVEIDNQHNVDKKGEKRDIILSNRVPCCNYTHCLFLFSHSCFGSSWADRLKSQAGSSNNIRCGKD